MKEKISRRSFLQVLGLGLGAAVLTACTPGAADSPVNSPAASVPDPDTAPEPFLSVEEFPRLYGSTACIPLMAQLKANVTGMDLLEAQTGITVSTTAYAWENFGLWSRSDSDDYGAQLLIVYEAPSTSRKSWPRPTQSWSRKPSAGTRWSSSSTSPTPSKA